MSKAFRLIHAPLLAITIVMIPSGELSAQYLEAPASGSTQSGVGLIYGWVCDADEVSIRIDGGADTPAVYGNPRGDTGSVCGDSDNGFELLWNWNLLEDGEHTLSVYADGQLIGQSDFTVVTLGLGEFARGLSGTFTLNDFPEKGRNTSVSWSEPDQNFRIRSVWVASGFNDTGQRTCYDSRYEIECPGEGEAFYGQDAQFESNTFSLRDNGDGTVTDNVTGLTWQQSTDRNGDGAIDAADKLTWDAAMSHCENLELAGLTDWRLPGIKTLYSLIDFSGLDVSGYEGTDTSGLTPFIDTDYFDYAYGDTSAGERIIDSQYASSTLYVSTTGSNQAETMFGVNFADGRIKGYGLFVGGSEKTFFVQCVRGSESFGENAFADNGDGTISDGATSLMWSQTDSGSEIPAGLDWEEALAWAIEKNAQNWLGHDDWRLPDAKELQSIVDYGRSPDATDSAAIDPVFDATPIVNEAGETDFAHYWSSTTHANVSQVPGAGAAYVAFGRAMGYMDGQWIDVHGAGAQRSDPKSGDPADYPTGSGPQGDAIRIYNHVRLVRDDR